MSFLCVCALLAVTQSPIHRGAHGFPGHVLVVGAGGAYADIQPAVNAASDGDAILVKTGSYSGFTILDKSLSVVADAGATVDVSGSVRVDGLAAQRTALLAGLVVHGPLAQPAGAGAVTAANDIGAVRIEDCTIVGASGSGTALPRAGVALDTDADVAIVACTISGGAGALDAAHPRDGAAGAPAVASSSSSVAVQDCVLRGGNGGDGALGAGQTDAGAGGAGGAACRITDGFVFAGGTELDGGTGGRGGDSGPCISNSAPGAGGAGGACVVVASAAPPPPNAALIGNYPTVGLGGAGGQDTSGTGCYGDGAPGVDGAIVVAPQGAVESFAGASRRFVCPRVARGNTFVPMTCYGRPGDMVTVVVGNAPDFTYDPSQRGVGLVSHTQSRVLASGTIPANGVLAFQIGLPSAGADARSLYLQVYARDTSNQRFIGSEVTLVELDPAY